MKQKTITVTLPKTGDSPNYVKFGIEPPPRGAQSPKHLFGTIYVPKAEAGSADHLTISIPSGN
jgi:hypothetical protein